MVGVQSEDFGGLVQAVHIVATVDGKVAADETRDHRARAPGCALPREIVLTQGEPARAPRWWSRR